MPGGPAYRNYVEQSAATGYVVGIQWFLALHQACTGRFFEGFNGEAANTGWRTWPTDPTRSSSPR